MGLYDKYLFLYPKGISFLWFLYYETSYFLISQRQIIAMINEWLRGKEDVQFAPSQPALLGDSSRMPNMNLLSSP